MENFFKWFNHLLNNGIIYKIAVTVTVIVFLWLLKKITELIIFNKKTPLAKRFGYKKLFNGIISVVFMIFLVTFWFEPSPTIFNFLGLLAAGLAVALQDFIKCFVGWFYVIGRKPFRTGDRIQVGEKLQGDVIDIGLLTTTINEINDWVELDQSTGRITYIPNSYMLSKQVHNYTAEFEYIWNEIEVLFTFESDWKRAKNLLHKALDEHVEKFSEEKKEKLRHQSKKFMIIYNKLTPIVYTTVKDSGVQLTARYLVKPRYRRVSEVKIWESLLDMVYKETSVDFAYNTVRFYKEDKNDQY